MTTYAAFAPMALGVAGGAIALLLAAWGRNAASVTCSVAGVALGALAAAWLATGEPVAAGGVMSTSPAVAACLLFGAVAMAASSRTLSATGAGARVGALSAFAAASAAAVAGSADALVLFLSVESLALAGYGLVALSGTDRAREAAMKWFVQGSVATAFFIVGLGVLLSRTGGSLAYEAIGKAAAVPGAAGPLAVGVVLVLSALAFKAGAFPFHSWMPDAFETAPPAAAAVMASAGKIGPLIAAVTLGLTLVGTTGERVLAVVAMLSVASIVFGNLAALRQRSLARMLAYSAIAQVGYALAGVPLAGEGGAGAVALFVMLYGLTSLASFVFIVALRETDGDWDGSIPGLAGLSRRHPALAASLVVIMLSLTGMPLTAGFWGKFLVFGTAATGGYLWLALAGVIGSVVSFAFYGGVLRSAYMDAGTAKDAPAQSASLATMATVVLALAILAAGVAPLLTGLGWVATIR